MAELNQIVIVGNLTQDPEVRYTPNGKAVADLRVAINETRKDSDGQVQKSTVFIAVTAWGRRAEVCAEYLRKGSPVLVTGKLIQEEWEKEGQKHSIIKILSYSIQFLSNKKKEDADDGDGRGGQEEKPESEPERSEGEAPDDNLPF